MKNKLSNLEIEALLEEDDEFTHTEILIERRQLKALKKDMSKTVGGETSEGFSNSKRFKKGPARPVKTKEQLRY